MSKFEIALRLFEMALEAAPLLVETIAGRSKAALKERIARARAAIAEPIDTGDEDRQRRARLRAIFAEPEAGEEG